MKQTIILIALLASIISSCSENNTNDPSEGKSVNIQLNPEMILGISSNVSTINHRYDITNYSYRIYGENVVSGDVEGTIDNLENFSLEIVIKGEVYMDVYWNDENDQSIEGASNLTTKEAVYQIVGATIAHTGGDQVIALELLQGAFVMLADDEANQQIASATINNENIIAHEVEYIYDNTKSDIDFEALTTYGSYLRATTPLNAGVAVYYNIEKVGDKLTITLPTYGDPIDGNPIVVPAE